MPAPCSSSTAPWSLPCPCYDCEDKRQAEKEAEAALAWGEAVAAARRTINKSPSVSVEEVAPDGDGARFTVSVYLDERDAGILAAVLAHWLRSVADELLIEFGASLYRPK